MGRFVKLHNFKGKISTPFPVILYKEMYTKGLTDWKKGVYN